LNVTLLDILDVLIVAFVLYKGMQLIRGTRATALIKGLAVVFTASVLARTLSLRTVGWILEQGTTVVLVALPVVFYPELRRALEQIGRGQYLRPFASGARPEAGETIDTIVEAVSILRSRRVGALVVLERETGLQEYVETGVSLDALITKELLMNIFEPNSPLHDGAAIIRGGRITAAACFLPLTESYLDSQLGTRHRAAVGLSEQTDAVVVVVSEESGAVSMAVEGRLRRYLNETRLREQLHHYWESAKTDNPFWHWRGRP